MFFRVNVAILNKKANERALSYHKKYKEWPDEAIVDLGSVVDQVCGVQDEYIKQFDIDDSTPISYLSFYRKNQKLRKIT
jgi:hypothetical protein